MTTESYFLTTLCIPTFNRRDVVYSLIQDLISEEINLISKIIVVDDGSTDMTFEALQEFNSIQNIKIYRNESNLSYAKNFLKCFHLSDTKFIIMGTDDDIFYKNGIQDIQKQLKSFDPDFISTRFKSLASTRIKKSRKEIDFLQIWNAAKHSPGIIYKRKSIISIEEKLLDLLERENLAAFFFPQIILATILKSSNKLLIFSEIEISRKRSSNQQKTQLLDQNGNHYLSLSNLTKRHNDFIIFYEELLQNSDYRNQHLNIKKLLLQHRSSLYENFKACLKSENIKLANDFRMGEQKKIISYFKPKKYYFLLMEMLKKYLVFSDKK